MGYFNYFIKCIIRNIAYKLCKPKVFLTVLLSVIIILLLHNTGYCSDWTDAEIEVCLDGLATITSNQGVVISQLSSLGVNVTDIENYLQSIDEDIAAMRVQLGNIRSDTSSIRTYIATINGKIDTLNTSINNIYNELDSNQRELIEILEENNNAILEELNMIRDALNSSEEELTTFTDLGVINSNSSNYKFRGISLNYESGYSYTIKLYCNSESYAKAVRVYYSDNIIPSGFNYEDYISKVIGVDVIPADYGTYIINYDVPSSKPTYIYFGWNVNITQIEVYRSIKGINDNLSQNNTLQQESNQLQQEQNNFLQQGTSDSDVSVDSFNSVDANDITSDGLTGIFTNIYNSISTWSSKDIVLPIPYTNKNITIPANYTNNMLNSVGGGWIITFINSIYYFIVARFIIYSITSIINSIKSGSILETDSKNNITTDML